MTRIGCLSWAFLLAASGAAQGQEAPASPAASSAPAVERVLGEVTQVDPASRTLTVRSDAGPAVSVVALEKATFSRALPGARDLTGATAIDLGDIAKGDRVMARGALSADGASLSARQIVVMTRADLDQKQDRDRADWARRGISGVITALDPAKQEITVETRGLTGSQTLVLETGPKNATLRRYAPDSVKFSEARPSTFTELKVGDQIRARGERAPDGARLLAEQVVTGSFQTLSGALKSVGAQGRELVLVDNETQKPLTVQVGPETMVRRLPAPMALRLAARTRGERGGAPGGERGGASGGERGGPGGERGGSWGAARAEEGGPGRPPRGPGGERRMGGGTLQDMLERLPPLPIAELKPGDQVAVSSTRGKDPSRVNAVVVLAGIEPLLESRPRGAAGGEASPGLPPGALDLGFGNQ